MMKLEERKLPMTAWAEEDRPREKLIARGTAALSNAELLALLVGTGSARETALSLSRKILLANQGSLALLAGRSVAELLHYKGLGPAKAVRIVAALELGKRMQQAPAEKAPKIRCSKDAFELLYPVMGHLRHEEFWILYLNNSNRVLHRSQRSKGGITATLVDLRLVFKEALEWGAVALILAHNHPSGNLEPSKADEQLTHKFLKASEALDLKVLDHLILCGKNYYSFADHNHL